MDKDPAFLFYSKDWLQGTAGMFPEEKGVYIDLLCHQHQYGYLPQDERRLSRLVGLGIDDFKKIWENIKHKFIQKDNHLVNQKLDNIADKRSRDKPRKTASATFAGLISSRKLNKKQIDKIKKKFRTHDFIIENGISITDVTVIKSKVREWFDQTVNNLENVNKNRNGVEVKEKIKEFNIPDIDCFLKYAVEKCPDINQSHVRLKYDAWKENGWKTGGKKPREIKNWKTTLLNTIPHMSQGENSLKGKGEQTVRANLLAKQMLKNGINDYNS